jgi:hypothetical protein
MEPTQAAGHQLKCSFCDRPAEATCTHRLSEPWIIYPHEARVGDMIEHSLTLDFHRCIGITAPRPEAITDLEDQNPEQFRLRLAMGGTAPREQSHRVTLPLLRRETRKCGRPACDRHLRDFGDEHYQCAAHWDLTIVYSPDA